MAPNGKGVLVITTEENVGLNEIINAVNKFQKSPEYRPWYQVVQMSHITLLGG